MCVPCAKKLINGGFTRAAEMAHDVRHLSLEPIQEVTPEQDEQLYRLACREIEAIAEVKRSAVEMGKMQGTPERWLKLLGRL